MKGFIESKAGFLPSSFLCSAAILECQWVGRSDREETANPKRSDHPVYLHKWAERKVVIIRTNNVDR